LGARGDGEGSTNARAEPAAKRRATVALSRIRLIMVASRGI
jgi:hypothetical protein